jgi:hypothetical protein
MQYDDRQKDPNESGTLQKESWQTDITVVWENHGYYSSHHLQCRDFQHDLQFLHEDWNRYDS